MSEETLPGADQASEQSNPGSVVDQLMDRFGDPEDTPTDAPEEDNAQVEGDDAPEVEAETPADDSVEVEFEGETLKVPQKIKDALLRQADYTRKTQEVADERKALMAEREFVTAQREFQKVYEKDIGELRAIDERLKQYNAVDWSAAMEKDLQAATTAFMQRQQLIEARTAVAANLSNAEQEFQQAQTQKANELRAKGLEELSKRIPGWSDATAKKVVEASKSYGFTDEELAAYRDPRVIHALYEAAKYRELIAQKPALTQKVTTLPKPVKPGSTEARATDAQIQQRKAESALKTTGSPAALRSLLEQRLRG